MFGMLYGIVDLGYFSFVVYRAKIKIMKITVQAFKLFKQQIYIDVDN